MNIPPLPGASNDTAITSVGEKPLAVPIKTACKLVGVENTKMWELISSGRVKTIAIGRKRLVIYSSLEALVAPSAHVRLGELPPAAAPRRRGRPPKVRAAEGAAS